MKTVPLGDVASFIRGVTFKPSDVLDRPTETSVGIMRTKNVQAELDTSDILQIPRDLVRRSDQYLRSGDVLVSSANSWNLVGRCSWVPELVAPAAIGGFVTALRVASDQVEPRYLYRWFSSPHTQAEVRNSANQTTNIANMNLKRCEALKIPLPSLDEQRRIATILDHVDALRAKQRRVMALAEGLGLAIFHEMFGDPDAPNSGQPAVRFGDIAELQGGRNLVADDSAARTPFRVLKISAVTSGKFKPWEAKPLPVEYMPPEAHLVRPGDLLISRANTAELVGAVAYVPACPPNLVLPDKIWRFVWKDTASVPLYYWALLSTPALRRRISRLSSGTGGSMKNISKAKLEQLELPYADPAQQRAFQKRLAAVPAPSVTEFDELFSALQSRAFSGEL